MAAMFSPDNAIAWAQVRLRGGWKNLAATASAYAVVVGGGIYSSAKLLASSPTSAYGGWLPALLGLQTAVLLLFGASRISAAIRQDHANRMIESHRMMPIGAGEAIIGYIAGATSQALTLAVVNVVLGVAVAVGAGIPIRTWLAANFILAAFCGFIWVLSAFWAFIVKAPFALLLVLALGTWFSRGLVLEFVPALTTLAGPIMGRTIFSFRTSATELNFGYVVSFASQAFIGAICFVGAARRFRRGDLPAFTLPLSLLLLAGWVTISCLTILHWEEFKPVFLSGRLIDTESQLIGSMLSSMILALTPIAASARAACEWRTRVLNDPRNARPPVPIPVVAAMATFIVMFLASVEWVAGNSAGVLADRVVRNAIVVFLFLLSSGYFLRVLIRCGIRSTAPVLIWLALYWLGPLLGDVVLHNVFDADSSRPILQTMSTCSPIGALLQIWPVGDSAYSGAVNTNAGIGAQALITAGFFLLDAMTRRKKNATRPQ